jgi:hypothetical protein
MLKLETRRKPQAPRLKLQLSVASLSFELCYDAPVTDDDQSRKEYLDRLRGWRNAPAKDLSLRFLADKFKREVAKPHKQMSQVAEAWQQLVPAPLLTQTALGGLTRGTLTIHVANSAIHYELSHLLRAGLERQLQQACKAEVKKVKLVVKRI